MKKNIADFSTDIVENAKIEVKIYGDYAALKYIENEELNEELN